MQKIKKAGNWVWTAEMIIAGIFIFSQSVFARPIKEKAIFPIQNSAYADVNTCLNIRVGAGMDFEVAAQLPKNGYCEVLRDDGDWWYIKSREIEGYVYKDYLIAGLTEKEYQRQTGNKEKIYAYKVEERGKIEETAFIPDAKRQEIVEFALQFVGNPYVWGGTSLTNGADCSGFVQSVYRNFGVDIPRIASDQANAGLKIPVQEAQPGDLIFYAENGSVYHVVMYIGNNQVVHASSTATGIKVSNVYREKAVWAVRLV